MKIIFLLFVLFLPVVAYESPSISQNPTATPTRFVVTPFRPTSTPTPVRPTPTPTSTIVIQPFPTATFTPSP
jgi:hypothetical protein